jgi:hypothetical protein
MIFLMFSPKKLSKKTFKNLLTTLVFEKTPIFFAANRRKLGSLLRPQVQNLSEIDLSLVLSVMKFHTSIKFYSSTRPQFWVMFWPLCSFFQIFSGHTGPTPFSGRAWRRCCRTCIARSSPSPETDRFKIN